VKQNLKLDFPLDKVMKRRPIKNFIILEINDLNAEIKNLLCYGHGGYQLIDTVNNDSQLQLERF
jgi:hypothetical protein